MAKSSPRLLCISPAPTTERRRWLGHGGMRMSTYVCLVQRRHAPSVRDEHARTHPRRRERDETRRERAASPPNVRICRRGRKEGSGSIKTEFSNTCSTSSTRPRLDTRHATQTLKLLPHKEAKRQGSLRSRPPRQCGVWGNLVTHHRVSCERAQKAKAQRASRLYICQGERDFSAADCMHMCGWVV